MKAGVSFEELSKSAWPMPDEFWDQRYSMAFHGMGMGDEWPSILYPADFIPGAFEYALEPGMIMTSEAYIGAVGGAEGIKLEEQVLITETGFEVMSRSPYETHMLD